MKNTNRRDLFGVAPRPAPKPAPPRITEADLYELPQDSKREEERRDA